VNIFTLIEFYPDERIQEVIASFTSMDKAKEHAEKLHPLKGWFGDESVAESVSADYDRDNVNTHYHRDFEIRESVLIQ
jgi:hypothetical protein